MQPGTDADPLLLVIPAYDEKRVLALEQGPQPGRVVLVVNEPQGKPSEGNRDLIARYSGRSDVHVLDLTGADALAGGVGEARARGFAQVMEGLSSEQLRDTWIRTTDADVELPSDYWNRLEAPKGTAACIYPFTHDAPSLELQPHVDAYEASLRYYVLGLAYAGSPYAFHTVGSTLAIRTESYAQVRGFPKRQAGEDFYLLNKLAKVGVIERLDREPLRLSGRASHRVPFGTGPSVATSLRDCSDPWKRAAYHPIVFSVLRALLSDMAELVERREQDRDVVGAKLRQAVARENERVATVVVARLGSDGTLDAIVRASRERNRGADRLRAVHTHFDAFRTLKLIHALRDQALGTLPLIDALQSAAFLKAPISTVKLHDNVWLREAEAALPKRTGVVSCAKSARSHVQWS